MTIMTRFLPMGALAAVLLSGACPAAAQPASPDPAKDIKQRLKAGSERFQARMEEAIRQLDKHPRLKDLSPPQRKDLIEFVTGNMLYATLHEMGHAHMQEMGLPVLGREEDAADAYAIVALLKVGTDSSHNVLTQAARGWFLNDARNQKEGYALAFYDEHGLDRQRAYQIVCLMVGSDPEKFSDLADQVKMPEDRQGTCRGDYSNASWSWEMVLKPHLRAPDQPKQKISVTYGEAGEFAAIADALKTLGMMEALANYAAERFVWRRPIRFEVKSCGEPNLAWDLSTQNIVVCHEMAQEFAQLYRGYSQAYAMGPDMNAKAGKKKK
jgi:Putative metallopeptidase